MKKIFLAIIIPIITALIIIINQATILANDVQMENIGNNAGTISELNQNIGNATGDKIINIQDYLNSKNTYDVNTLVKRESHSTAEVTNGIPINMQGNEFPESEVLTAVDLSTTDSSYGGCGPIALIGMMHYLSKNMGYSEILNNPTNSTERIRLAREVFDNVLTDTLFGSTLALPSNMVAGFNNLIAYYGLSSYLNANYEFDRSSDKKQEYINIIKEQIKKGMPIIVGFGDLPSNQQSGNSAFAWHYVNIYGYEIWEVENTSKGVTEEKMFIKARLNFSGNFSVKGQSYSYDDDIIYADADILGASICTLIWVDITYDYNKTFTADDFASKFVDESTGQESFVTTPKSAIVDKENYSISTKRLRCTYSNTKDILLSTNHIGSEEAFLEFKLNNEIRGLDFNIGLYSKNDNYNSILINFQIAKLDKNGNIVWYDYKDFNILDLPAKSEGLKKVRFVFNNGIFRFRIFVNNPYPTSTEDSGKIVLNNFIFKYDEKNTIHNHSYKYTRTSTRHTGNCICGETTEGTHVIRSGASTGRFAACIECGYLVDTGKDVIIFNGIKPQYVSNNGSYIYANGIIVLVDDDYEMFISGELVFHECSEETI